MESQAESTIFGTQVVNKRQLDIKAKCIKGSDSNLACNNTNCQEYAFVCSNRNC